MADGSRSPKRDQRAFHFPALAAILEANLDTAQEALAA